MPNKPEAAIESANPLNGGLVTWEAPHAIPRNFSPDAQNFDPSYFAGVKKRKGYVKFTDPAKPTPTGNFVSGLFATTTSAGTTYVMSAEGTALHDISAGDWGTTVSGVTITVNTPVRMRMFNDLILICNPGGGPYKWTGSGAAADLGGTPPAASKGLCIHKNRVWMWGKASNPSRIYWSAADNPEDWTTPSNAGSEEVDISDGASINGAESSGDVMYVSKLAVGGTEGYIYARFGDDSEEMVNRRVAYFPACNQESMVPYDGIMVVASPRGIYSISGRGVALLSRDVQTTYEAISDKSTIAGGRYLNQVWFAYKDGASSTNNAMLVLDFPTGRWSKYTGISAKVLATHPDGRLLSGRDSTTIVVDEQNNGTNDDSAAISFHWSTPDLDFGAWDRDKIPWQLMVHTSSSGSDVTIERYLDGELQTDSPAVTMETLPAGSMDRMVHREVMKSGQRAAMFVRYKLSNAVVDNDITVYGFKAYARTLEPTRTIAEG